MEKVKGKKILYFCGPSGRTEWMYEIAKEFESAHSSKSYYLTTSKYEREILKSEQVPAANIFFIERFTSRNGNPDLKYLKDAETKWNFNIWDIWAITSVRKKSREKLPEYKILIQMEHWIRSTELMLNKCRPDYLVIFGPAAFFPVIVYQIAKARGVEIIELQNARIAGNFSISNNLEMDRPLLHKIYGLVKNRNLTQEQKDVAQEFVYKFLNNSKGRDLNLHFKESISDKLLRYVGNLRKLLKTRDLPPNLKFLIWPLIQKFYDIGGYFENPNFNEKFVLYNLQYTPEASTLIYGKWYWRQIELLENISRSLPVDFKLYIKEHRFGYGNRKLSFYRRIKAIKNARLITPHCDNIELIKLSSLCITITGTIGWEALLYNKPVITFGDVYFNLFDGVTKVEKILDLPRIIRDRLGKKLEHDALLKIVYSVIASSHKGIVRCPGDCKNYTLKIENSKLIVKGITNYIELTPKLPSNKVSV